MLKDKEWILDWIIIILCIVLIVALAKNPFTDCNTCSFDGKTTEQFFREYSSKCFQSYSYGQENPNLEKTNLTFSSS